MLFDVRQVVESKEYFRHHPDLDLIVSIAASAVAKAMPNLDKRFKPAQQRHYLAITALRAANRAKTRFDRQRLQAANLTRDLAYSDTVPILPVHTKNRIPVRTRLDRAIFDLYIDYQSSCTYALTKYRYLENLILLGLATMHRLERQGMIIRGDIRKALELISHG